MAYSRHISPILLFFMLSAALLLSSWQCPVLAQGELSPQEREVLAQRDARNDAEQVNGGDYSKLAYAWGTTLQIGVFLATLGLLGLTAWLIVTFPSRLQSANKRVPENRQWKRVQVPFEIADADLVAQPEHRFQGRAHVQNICQGGACVRLSDATDKLQPEHDLQLRIQVKDEVHLALNNLSGTVRWIRNNMVGIQFNHPLHYDYTTLDALFTQAAKNHKKRFA